METLLAEHDIPTNPPTLLPTPSHAAASHPPLRQDIGRMQHFGLRFSNWHLLHGALPLHHPYSHSHERAEGHLHCSCIQPFV